MCVRKREREECFVLSHSEICPASEQQCCSYFAEFKIIVLALPVMKDKNTRMCSV